MMQVWVVHQLEKAEIKLLDELCGKPGDKNRVRVRRNKKLSTHTQCVQLRQPTPEALRLLDRLVRKKAMAWDPGPMINRLELALDLVFETSAEAVAAQHFLEMHFAQAWHGKRRTFRVGGTSYNSLDRWVRHTTVIYSDRPSKVTGAPHCCHLEWRVNTAEAVRGIGINGLLDVVKFDHQEFWTRHMRLLDVDIEKFGRAYLNMQKNTRRRFRWIQNCGGYPYNRDLRTGGVLIRSAQQEAMDGESVRDVGAVQTVIDHYGKIFKFRSALTRIPADVLLPEGKA